MMLFKLNAMEKIQNIEKKIVLFSRKASKKLTIDAIIWYTIQGFERFVKGKPFCLKNKKKYGIFLNWSDGHLTSNQWMNE